MSEKAKADRLAEIFDLQYELNKRIGIDTCEMDESERVKWLLNYSRALSQETAELVDSVPWKWWAKYQTLDLHNVKIEIVDMLHFLVSLALVAGMTADDFHRLYVGKNALNHERQDSGYVRKSEDDNIGLDA